MLLKKITISREWNGSFDTEWNAFFLNIDLFWCHKTNNECFHSCNGTKYFHSVKIFSFGGKFNLSPHENIFTTALINIHYLYINVICFRFIEKYMYETYDLGPPSYSRQLEEEILRSY